jgi:hypothetical protein
MTATDIAWAVMAAADVKTDDKKAVQILGQGIQASLRNHAGKGVQQVNEGIPGEMAIGEQLRKNPAVEAVPGEVSLSVRATENRCAGGSMRLETDKKLTREFTGPPNIAAPLAMVSNKLRRASRRGGRLRRRPLTELRASKTGQTTASLVYLMNRADAHRRSQPPRRPQLSPSWGRFFDWGRVSCVWGPCQSFIIFLPTLGMFSHPLGGLFFVGETLDSFRLAIRPENINHPAKSWISPHHESGPMLGHPANMRLWRPSGI